MKTLYCEDPDIKTSAYSFFPSKYTGALKLIVVATLESFDIFTFTGSITTSENGRIFKVGVPSSTVLI